MRFTARLLFLLASITSIACAQTNGPQGLIKHVIVIIQENRTPDFLFGSYPGFEAGVNLPPLDGNGKATGNCLGANIELQPQTLYTSFDIGHTHSNFLAMCDLSGTTCKMDGASNEFYPPPTSCHGTGLSTPKPFGYAANDSTTNPVNEVQPYFDIAKAYGFANYMFQTNQGPSFPAHQFLFSGTSAPVTDGSSNQTLFASENPTAGPGGAAQGSPTGCLGWVPPAHATLNVVQQLEVSGSSYTEGYFWNNSSLFPSGNGLGYPCYEHRTIADLLDNTNPKVTWKYYTNDPTSLWTAPNAIQAICNPSQAGGPCNSSGSDWGNVISERSTNNPPNPAQILTDIMTCNLANVSFVVPDGQWSDHAGSNNPPALGPSWVSAIVNAVGQGVDPACQTENGTTNYWKDTVIFVTWDDWGGWYDHVSPPSANGYVGGGTNGQQYVYGFRVPLLVVSPYAKKGYVSGAWTSGPQPTQCPPTTPQYCHDFGSILNFIEYTFGSGGNSLGGTNGISSSNYQYADYYAIDGPNVCGLAICPYSLADFFDFTTANPFTSISAPYGPLYFITYANAPQPPDNDGH